MTIHREFTSDRPHFLSLVLRESKLLLTALDGTPRQPPQTMQPRSTQPLLSLSAAHSRAWVVRFAQCTLALMLVLFAETATAQVTNGLQNRPQASARSTRRQRRRRPRPPTFSMGFANLGTLQNGIQLPETSTVRYMPGRPHHHGTEELIGLVNRAAAAVNRETPGKLTVGDMSDHDGGPIGHHASHQSGRDVDIGFYVTDSRGRPAEADDYISFNGQGRPMAGGNLRFDVARNWALINALITDPSVGIDHIFVSTPLRALLINHARAIHARPMAIVRAQLVLHQPRHALPHSNHFHVRIDCPPGDTQCREGIHVRPRARVRRRGRGRPALQHRARPAHSGRQSPAADVERIAHR